jgi:hypothetical protein
MNKSEVITAGFPRFRDRSEFINAIIGEIDNGLFKAGKIDCKACDAIIILEELRAKLKEKYPNLNVCK